MRSQLVLRRTRLFSSSSPPSRALLSYSNPARYPRKEQHLARNARLSRRASSSTTTPSPDAAATPSELPSSSPEGQGPPEGNGDDKPPLPPDVPEQPTVRTRTTKASKTESTKEPEAPILLPNGLDILWTAESLAGEPASSMHPPPEIFDEALNNLWLTFHPQTQHRAVYGSAGGPPTEPTLALYCPVEGGDYIVDATVKELARQTESDVVVIDAVQLAAGECGQFGKAATVLNLPQNPLHFAPPPPPSPSSQSRRNPADDDDDDWDTSPSFGHPMSLTVLTPMRPSRIPTPSRGVLTSALAVRNFFNQLVNVSEPDATSGRPRIVYVRDFGTLAATSSSWYPGLLAAVRARRQGPVARPTSPVSNSVTIVFGITPPLHSTPSSASTGSGNSGQGVMSLVMSRTAATSSHHPSGARPPKSEFGEDEFSDKARERRLRERLVKWERADPSLLEELPKLNLPEDDEDGSSGGATMTRGENGVVVIGGSGSPSGVSGLSSFFSPFASSGRSLSSVRGDRSGGGNGKGKSGSDAETNSKFFRTTVIVPRMRSVANERMCRVARRREINELTMRMGVSAVGGELGKMMPSTSSQQQTSSNSSEVEDEADAGAKDNDESKSSAVIPAEAIKMWEDWGKRLESWPSVKQTADQAVGMVVSRNAANERKQAKKLALSTVPVPWEEVFKAWGSQRSTKDVRKAWVQKSSRKGMREQEEDEGNEDADEDESIVEDEVVERLKRDSYLLERHEQRLLGCIVDAASMPTSFSQVHLPPHTIDSVRTIVSLPLLHPSSFQHGILKEHGMTGCLLFGPPGTGKTLVVRALAKEAGCRMLAISPSDVMDMYVGEGEKLVRSVFSLARQLSPCVVFIDEIDALFGARSSARETGGAIAHRGVLTEFMQEMDGLKSSKGDNVIVIGATNRPFDLDDAVLRRLPRRLLVDLPGEKERMEILNILLREESLAPEVDLNELAKKTESFSGSDLKHLCVSAALDAVKEHVSVPWKTNSTPTTTDVSSTSAETPSKSDNTNSSTPVESKGAVSDIEDIPSSPDTSPEAESTPLQATALDTEATDSSTGIEDVDAPIKPSEDSIQSPTPQRVLQPHHFTKALKEITPSSSESLGSLAELRKWNEEFGEGRKQRKKQVWGKDRFGFTNQTVPVQEGKVGPLTASILDHIARSRDS